MMAHRKLRISTQRRGSVHTGRRRDDIRETFLKPLDQLLVGLLRVAPTQRKTSKSARGRPPNSVNSTETYLLRNMMAWLWRVYAPISGQRSTNIVVKTVRGDRTSEDSTQNTRGAVRNRPGAREKTGVWEFSRSIPAPLLSSRDAGGAVIGMVRW